MQFKKGRNKFAAVSKTPYSPVIISKYGNVKKNGINSENGAASESFSLLYFLKVLKVTS